MVYKSYNLANWQKKCHLYIPLIGPVPSFILGMISYMLPIPTCMRTSNKPLMKLRQAASCRVEDITPSAVMDQWEWNILPTNLPTSTKCRSIYRTWILWLWVVEEGRSK